MITANTALTSGVANPGPQPALVSCLTRDEDPGSIRGLRVQDDLLQRLAAASISISALGVLLDELVDAQRDEGHHGYRHRDPRVPHGAKEHQDCRRDCQSAFCSCLHSTPP